jgi:uncharacterized protein YkwD
MRRSLHTAFLVISILCIVSCSKEAVTPGDIPVAVNAIAVEQELLELVNTHRSAIGATALEYSALAYEYANLHTDYMVAKGTISHDNFSARASKIAAETNAKEVAENVAMDYPTAAEAFQGWLESPNHKGTMEADYTHTAVSVKINAAGDYFYTQLFFK